MKARVRALLRAVGIDRAVGVTVLGTSWTSLAGLATVVFIVHFLSGAEQGFYYTFASILAMKVFFELGLAYVTLQCVSHESAMLHWTKARVLSGDKRAEARLSSLFRWACTWYSAAAALMIVIVIPLGWYFFAVTQSAHSEVAWRAPWMFVGMVTGATLVLSPLVAFVEGGGKVAEVAGIRLAQAMSFSISLWLGLACHLGLYAAPLATLAGLLVAVLWLMVRYRAFYLDLVRATVGHVRISWRDEIWPFQWRIALSTLSGYFIFYLFTPVLFAYHGPIEAGKMGMSISVASAVSGLSIAWMNTKSPRFGAWAAQQRWRELDAMFIRTLAQSSAVAVCASVAAWALVWGLNAASLPIADRLLQPSSFGVLLLTVVVNNVVFCEALYLRSHKREPFLLISVASGVLTGLSTWLLGRYFGAVGMLLGYLAVSTVVGLGAGTVVFVARRRVWHQANDETTNPANRPSNHVIKAAANEGDE